MKNMTYPETIDLTTEMLMGHLASVSKKGRDAVYEALKQALLEAFRAGQADGEAAHGDVSQYASRPKAGR